MLVILAIYYKTHDIVDYNTTPKQHFGLFKSVDVFHYCNCWSWINYIYHFKKTKHPLTYIQYSDAYQIYNNKTIGIVSFD